MRKALALSAALALAGLGLAACSSSDSASETPMVGGMTECTKEAVQPAVDEAVLALGSSDNQMPIENLDCADGWAVASGTLGPKDAPADGPQGAPTSFIFEQEGQFWIPKDKAQVCGTSEADSEVPAALYMSGCAAG
jgi:hypothetical protein